MKKVVIALWIGLLGALLFFAASPAFAEGEPGAEAEVAAVQPGDSPAPPKFTYNGPVGEKIDDTDKVFLQKVRQAGMWERPMGQLAQRKGNSARTREVGKLIDFDHANLDDDVTKIGDRLGVTMPAKATPEQDLWMADIRSKSGEEFDKAFAHLLRDAHGAVFQLIAHIRAYSRNDLVRAFASHASNVVHRHMVLLESTGGVNFDRLPKAKGTTGRTRPYRQEPIFVIALITVAAVVGITGVYRAIRA